MVIVYIIIGVALGGVVGYLIAQSKFSKQLTEQKVEAGKLATQLKDEQEKHERENMLRQEQQQQHDNTIREQQLKQEQLLKEQFNEQINTLKEQFSTLAQKVLDTTSTKLKDANSEQMANITKPLRDNLESLQKAIQDTNKETAKSTSSLAEQLKQMAEQTSKIDQTATRLTNVIRGGNKAQGNWGEQMLQSTLDAMGFVQGVNYELQQTITDEKGASVANDDSGKRMIPDAIIYYPNNEAVVIDSKMSIDAYYQYINTESEQLKAQYAKELVKSIRTQANNLAKKEYGRYIKAPRRAIDFVIMFVPNEGALQLALTTEPKLWIEAFDKQVFITSQQNLMAILKIIQIAWRQYNQTVNQQKVFDIADELLKRIGDFVKRFEKFGKTITNLKDDYDDVYNKTYTGRQSIIQKANELKSLGATESAKYPIPESLPEIDGQ